MADVVRYDRWGAGAVMAASLLLLAAWPGWRMAESPKGDAYAQSPELFLSAAESFAAAHGEGGVVRPPAGADVPVVARRFEFWPALELKAGQSYRLHVASLDAVHSVVIEGRELSLMPGEVRVVEVTPHSGGLTLQCGEYCGLGHNRMRADVRVAP